MLWFVYVIIRHVRDLTQGLPLPSVWHPLIDGLTRVLLGNKSQM